ATEAEDGGSGPVGPWPGERRTVHEMAPGRHDGLRATLEGLLGARHGWLVPETRHAATLRPSPRRAMSDSCQKFDVRVTTNGWDPPCRSVDRLARPWLERCSADRGVV